MTDLFDLTMRNSNLAKNELICRRLKPTSSLLTENAKVDAPAMQVRHECARSRSTEHFAPCGHPNGANHREDPLIPRLEGGILLVTSMPIGRRSPPRKTGGFEERRLIAGG
jgi:hypothetical protein